MYTTARVNLVGIAVNGFSVLEWPKGPLTGVLVARLKQVSKLGGFLQCHFNILC